MKKGPKLSVENIDWQLKDNKTSKRRCNIDVNSACSAADQFKIFSTAGDKKL